MKVVGTTALLLGLLSVPVAGASSEIKQFPKLASESAIVAVVELAPGGVLPPFPPPTCKPSNAEARCVIVNMDPAPFWLHVTTLQQITGDHAAPDRFVAATSSHYGMRSRYDGPYLALFVTDGTQFVMRRYANLPLVRTHDGSLHLPLWQWPIASWLPCETESLREEFLPDAVLPQLREESLDFSLAKERPELFRISATGVLPRYMIPVAKLGSHLSWRTQDPNAKNCQDPLGTER